MSVRDVLTDNIDVCSDSSIVLMESGSSVRYTQSHSMFVVSRMHYEMLITSPKWSDAA